MEYLRRWLEWTRQLSMAARLALATLLVLLAALLHWGLDPYMADYPYILFLAAVTVVSLSLERGSGIYATFLGALLAIYLFVEPRYSLLLEPGETVALMVYLVAALGINIITEAVRLLMDRLDDAERRKDSMLRELHHRTRNNMQIINALIGMEMARTGSEEARTILASLATRISSAGQLQQMIWQPDTADRIEANELLENLCDMFSASLLAQHPVTLACSADRCLVSRDTASALGITLNELLTNAVKYAFPGGRAGSTIISLSCEPDGTIALTVEDDGVGCPERPKRGTGLMLIEAILRQHKGEISIEDADPGCRVRVRIPKAAKPV